MLGLQRPDRVRGRELDQQPDRAIHSNRILVGIRSAARHQPLEYHASRLTPSPRPHNRPLELEVRDCVGAVISPLLSNIYLHALDRAFADGAHGTLVRYADDFVVAVPQRGRGQGGQRLAGEVLAGLGLELHPEKTRMVDLRDGREGFDFLGCHFHARVSGQDAGARRSPLLPSALAFAAGDETYPSEDQSLTGRGRKGTDIRNVIARSIRSCAVGATTFAPGTPPRKFLQIDWYVCGRLRGLMRKRYGRNLRPGQTSDLDARVVRGSRPLSPARHRPLSGTRVVTIRKTIGKPCAGKPHARIERGMGKRA